MEKTMVLRQFNNGFSVGLKVLFLLFCLGVFPCSAFSQMQPAPYITADFVGKEMPFGEDVPWNWSTVPGSSEDFGVQYCVAAKRCGTYGFTMSGATVSRMFKAIKAGGFVMTTASVAVAVTSFIVSSGATIVAATALSFALAGIIIHDLAVGYSLDQIYNKYRCGISFSYYQCTGQRMQNIRIASLCR